MFLSNIIIFIFFYVKNMVPIGAPMSKLVWKHLFFFFQLFQLLIFCKDAQQCIVWCTSSYLARNPVLLTPLHPSHHPPPYYLPCILLYSGGAPHHIWPGTPSYLLPSIHPTILHHQTSSEQNSATGIFPHKST